MAERKKLPDRRAGYTQKMKMGGQTIYMRTGEYPDGTLGEIFLDNAKAGATLRGILSHFAIAVSLGLQHGVPLEEFVDAFQGTRYEPCGPVDGHPVITQASSLTDLVFRDVAITYLGRHDLADREAPPRENENSAPTDLEGPESQG